MIKFETVEAALAEFKKSFESLTGNEFNSGKFEKKPEMYQILDIEYDQRATVFNHLVKSDLDKTVGELMKLICDEKAMKDKMLTFDVDTDHMPLGKISKAQIEIAANILDELSALVKNNGTKDTFIEASNRFYTMIPHTFAQNAPPIINTAEMIAKKTKMIKHLQKIKLTYSLLNGTDEKTNPLDHIYKNLNADIKPLKKTSFEYSDIETYLNQTHGRGTSTRKLKVLNVFEVARNGEAERFRAFESLNNRRLLWHGSNLTNFIGILSNGLKISPTEAHSAGANFGRGIYFADAVAKSTHYCTFDEQKTGLLLLCEVALGDSHKLYRPEYIKELPNDKHSTQCIGLHNVPGLLQRNGLQIPFGHLVSVNDAKVAMDFNEFVVYKEAQVKIRYLVKVKRVKFPK